MRAHLRALQENQRIKRARRSTAWHKGGHDGIWLVSFMTCNLGFIELELTTLQTIDNLFATRLSPKS